MRSVGGTSVVDRVTFPESVSISDTFGLILWPDKTKSDGDYQELPENCATKGCSFLFYYCCAGVLVSSYL